MKAQIEVYQEGEFAVFGEAIVRDTCLAFGPLNDGMMTRSLLLVQHCEYRDGTAPEVRAVLKALKERFPDRSIYLHLKDGDKLAYRGRLN